MIYDTFSRGRRVEDIVGNLPDSKNLSIRMFDQCSDEPPTLLVSGIMLMLRGPSEIVDKMLAYGMLDCFDLEGDRSLIVPLCYIVSQGAMCFEDSTLRPTLKTIIGSALFQRDPPMVSLEHSPTIWVPGKVGVDMKSELESKGLQEFVLRLGLSGGYYPSGDSTCG